MNPLTEREKQALAQADYLNSILSQSSIENAAKSAIQRQRTQNLGRLQRADNAAGVNELALAAAIRDRRDRADSTGPFSGSSMEAQTLNALWPQARAKGMTEEQFRSYMAAQRAGRPTTVSTPDGTYVQPGYDLSALGYQSQSTPAASGFTAKKRSEGEKRGIYTVETLKQLDAKDNGYVPTPTESLSTEYAPDSVGGYVQSPEYREQRAVADEWARTLVFLRSGATARQEEVDAAVRNFWPQPGDTKADVTRKKQARKEAMSAAEKAYNPQQERPGDKYLR